MPSKVTVGSALAVLLIVTAAVSAQSLGDLARREAERRKTIKSTGKVYTNDTLRSEPPPVGAPAPTAQGSQPAQPPPAAVPPSPSGAQAQPGSPAPAAQVPPGQAPPGQAPPAQDETKTQAYWQKRIAAERDALSRAQIFAEALQSRINGLSTDFVNRDDPAQRNVIAADRQKALAELERVKQEIQQHQKAIADIQAEARKAGVPAGWVR